MGSRGGRVTSRGRRRTRQGCGGGRSQPGGSSAGGRSGRQARPGSGGAAALTSLGAEVPPLESPPWLVRAGGRPRPRLRPAAAGLLAGPQEPRGRRSTPVALGAGRLQSRREQWSQSWCPGGGAGGGLPYAARGLQTLWPPSPDPAAAPHDSCSPGSIALRGPRRRGVPESSLGTGRPAGRPSDRRKVRGLRRFSSCGARSRPEKARSPQCAKRSLGPVRTLPPSSGHSPGSSARCGWTRVWAPTRRRLLPRPPVPAGALGALCAGEARGLPLSLPPRASPTSSSSPCNCLLGLVVSDPRAPRSGERAKLACTLLLLACSI